MRKPVKIVAALLFVAIITVVVWREFFPRQHEPVYQGKPLSVWLIDHPGTAELTNTVRQIGTNGIPTLLKMLCNRKYRPPSKLMVFWNRHIAASRSLPGFLRYPASHRNDALRANDAALRGFRILGADAGNSVPVLLELYEQHNSIVLPDHAGLALLAVRPEVAVPVFVRDTGNSNRMVRLGAVVALWHAQSEYQLAVPALTNLLSDPDDKIRGPAARGLRIFGTNAQAAVPALQVSALNDPNLGIRNEASNALCRIHPERADGASAALESLRRK